MNQKTELRKEIAFYEKVVACTDRKLVKDAARGKKLSLMKRLNKLITSNGTEENI